MFMIAYKSIKNLTNFKKTLNNNVFYAVLKITGATEEEKKKKRSVCALNCFCQLLK